MSAKMAGMNDIERLEKEVQTTKASVVAGALMSLTAPYYDVCFLLDLSFRPSSNRPRLPGTMRGATNLSSVIIQRTIELMAAELGNCGDIYS
ncbi:unnamed protein product [Mesocestoides corti]|uniref:Uncharacterized protein n=1 Tax=Mesocestoides corti TaxID=53468 RepID=A0A0R3UDI5_MESCO|nr:unnamed protein product [Mesocestoides corti]